MERWCIRPIYLIAFQPNYKGVNFVSPFYHPCGTRWVWIAFVQFSRFVAMPSSAMATVSCIACNPTNLPAHSPPLWRRHHGTPFRESFPTRFSCHNSVGKPQCCLPSSSSTLECSSDSASSSCRAASRRDILILAGGGAAAAAFPSLAQEVFHSVHIVLLHVPICFC